MQLTAENVHAVCRDCLFEAGEPQDDAICADGLNATFGFHPQRLTAHRADIAAMLAELPEQFHAKTGSGWSFLNACVTKTGEQWGEHQVMQSLLVLGLASGFISYVMPREMWRLFPGGMPYFVVDLDAPPPVKVGPPS